MRGFFSVVLLVCGCRGSGNEAKQMPKTPPPPSIDVPEVSIAVEVDGVARAPIDGARLRATAPDYADEDRRAWRIAPLVGAPAGSQISVTGEGGIAVVMPAPVGDKEPQPSLMLSRRGQLVAMMLSPGDPFPAFHGQGRRMQRPGDSLPHVVNVSKIAVRSPGARR